MGNVYYLKQNHKQSTYVKELSSQKMRNNYLDWAGEQKNFMSAFYSCLLSVFSKSNPTH